MLPSVVARLKPFRQGDPQPRMSPRIVDWLDQLTRYQDIPSDYPIHMWTVGIAYGTQNATFSEIVNDRLTLAVGLLRADQPELADLADGAVKDAERTAVAISKLARNIAQAAGSKEPDGPGARASEQLYAALDRPYRNWLTDLLPDTDIKEARRKWQMTVLGHARKTSSELVRSAPPVAWVGRKIKSQLVNVAIAEAWFFAEMRNVLPAAFSRNETQPTEAA